MASDGFDVDVNPLGALYNPMSIAAIVRKALSNEFFTEKDLVCRDGIYHALQFESSRRHDDPEQLLARLNDDMARFRESLSKADVWIITFGTANVFRFVSTDEIVGNCHKLDSRLFQRSRLTVDDIVNLWGPLIQGQRVIFTVSPVRHLADGLHGNNLSKSTLLLATEKLGEYFPAYEIVLDDLRDYRFYAADMKHPSDVASDYVYEVFCDTYYSQQTKEKALYYRKQYLSTLHRPIL